VFEVGIQSLDFLRPLREDVTEGGVVVKERSDFKRTTGKYSFDLLPR
jgi:hypothetical protein